MSFEKVIVDSGSQFHELEAPSDGVNDFDFDVPVTPEDIAWQRRVRRVGVSSFAEYLRLISQEHVPVEVLGRRKLPIGYQPFEL